ncbi:MAG: glutathione S-transferase family protein [Proteobacteria bacterium]|nr:glutathione S-transferase family protein [Pseudomonadota bacterium]
MLKIYGVYHSRASRILWLAYELGVPFEHVPVIQAERLPDAYAPDAPLNTRSVAFRAINPNAKIPSIDDDGLVLHESLAINLYLAKKHGGPLAPADLAEEGRMAMWTLWAATEVEPHSLQVLLHNKAGAAPGTRPPAVEEAVATLRAPFAVLDAHLAAHPYIVGDRFTVADINAAEVIRYATTATDLFDAAPHVKEWLARCHARPAFNEMFSRRLAETA